MSGNTTGGASAPPGSAAANINKAIEELDDIIGMSDEGDIIEVNVSLLENVRWFLLGALGQIQLVEQPPATVHTLRVIPGYAEDEGGDAS